MFLLCDALHIEERGVFLSILTPTPSHFPVLLLRQQQSKVFAHTFMFSSCSFWHGMHPELVYYCEINLTDIFAIGTVPVTLVVSVIYEFKCKGCQNFSLCYVINMQHSCICMFKWKVL